MPVTAQDIVALKGYAWWTPLDSAEGKPGVVQQLRIKVVVTDARAAYGRVDCLIKPTDGSGSCWVSKVNLDLTDRT